MSRSEWQKAGVLAVVIGILVGCEAPSPSCPAENIIQGVCAGVPPLAAGARADCAAEGPCASAVEVASDSALQTALAGAAAGSCVTLAPGGYKAVDLPGGVSLAGRSADTVTIEGVTLAAGKDAMLCGVTVGAGGVKVNGATDARVDSVRVSGSTATGIDVAPGSSVDVVASEIIDSGAYGIAALEADDSTRVHLQETLVARSAGGGLWVECAAACGCMAGLDVSRSILRENRIIGAAITGATSFLDDVAILQTKPGDTIEYGKHGGGLSIADCANVLARKGLRVEDNSSFGILVDGATAVLGGMEQGEGVDVKRNVRGVWIQNVSSPHSVHVGHGTLDSNEGVGLGVSGDSQGIILCKSAVTGTQSFSLPVDIGGTENVGDGFNWRDGSEVTVEDVTLSGNARASLVIDGSVTGKLTNITLSGGDEMKGILQQNLPMGGSQPTSMNAPPITTNTDAVLSLATPPEGP